MPLDQALAMIADGLIIDAKTIILLRQAELERLDRGDGCRLNRRVTPFTL